MCTNVFIRRNSTITFKRVIMQSHVQRVKVCYLLEECAHQLQQHISVSHVLLTCNLFAIFK